MDLVMVGACYLDTILTVSHYPEEDTKLRASNIETRRGGNCPNSLDVLQQLVSSPDGAAAAARLHLVSCLPRRGSPAAQQVLGSFGPSSPISFRHSIYREAAAEAASSYIIRSQASGSRTLVNYNPLEEMAAEEFAGIAGSFDAEGASWWHFEGRIPETTLQCMRLLRRTLPRARLSVEVEKPGREGLRVLAAEADVVFYSKAWAEDSGYDSAEACLETEPKGRAFLTLCPWGAGGAYAMSHLSGEQIHCPVEQPPDEVTVVDSVGAGDTFIAGMLYGLTSCLINSGGGGSYDYKEWDARKWVQFAVNLATLKVQREGFAKLGDDIRPKHPSVTTL